MAEDLFLGDEDDWAAFLRVGTVYVEPPEPAMVKPKNEPPIA